MNLEHYDQAIDRYKLALQKAQSLGSLALSPRLSATWVGATG
jgi:hypothetical protein